MKFIYCCIFLFAATNLFAKNYYVSAKSGNSNNSGLSPSNAKKFIQDAADITKPGDTVFVMNGTYTSPCDVCNVLEIKRSGKPGKYIVYTNYANHRPVISFNWWAGITVIKGASYIKISGFEVIGCNAKIKLSKALLQPKSCFNKEGEFDAKYNGNGIVIDGREKHSHHVVIANNIVHDCGGGGIGASQSDYITIANNVVYNTSWYSLFGTSGISLYQFWNSDNAPGYHNFISGNKCYNNRSYVPWIKNCKIDDGNGIIIDDFRSRQNGSKLGEYKGRTLIVNNVCWYNGGTGIHTFQSDHVDIINNTAYCNSQTKELNAGQILSGLGKDNKIINNILVSDAENIMNSNFSNINLLYENNLHYNVTTPGKEQMSVNSASCISGANPEFIAPGNNLKADFRLRSTSPAIARGASNASSSTDIDGKKRGQNHAFNMGAYENQ